MRDSRSTAGVAGRNHLSSLVRRHWPKLVALASVSFVGALLEASFLVLITAVAVSFLEDEDIIGPYLGLSISRSTAVLAAIGLLVVRFALSLGSLELSTALSKNVATEQRAKLASAYLRADWAVQQSEPSGQLQILTTSFVTWAYTAISAVTAALGAVLSILAFLFVGIAVDPVLTTLALVVVLGLGVTLAPIRRRIRARSQATVRHAIAFAKSVTELGSVGLEMQTYGVRDGFEARISNLSEEELRARKRASMLSGSLGPIYTTMAYFAILAGIGAMTLGASIDLATIGTVLLLMVRALSQGQAFQSALGRIAESEPYLDRMVAAVERYETSSGRGGQDVPTSLTPLELCDVSFAYPNGRLALSRLTLNVARGETVGVIGPSGAGKSTLAQILLGLRRPTTGSVQVAGVDLDRVDRSWWSKRVAFVAQDAMLLTGTIEDNIRFFREGLTQSAIQSAAMRASVLKDIEALPKGFGTHLGERGSQLSGGQRQRISIARALAGEPEFLILDEPTSALDGQSESLVRDTLGQLRGEVTILIIAHRMSTLEMCDRIMVLEGGIVTACDTPQAVYRSSEFYRRSLELAGMSPPDCDGLDDGCAHQ